jgi:hypothetical protein
MYQHIQSTFHFSLYIYHTKKIILNINKIKIEDIKLRIDNLNRIIHYEQNIENKVFF